MPSPVNCKFMRPQLQSASHLALCFVSPIVPYRKIEIKIKNAQKNVKIKIALAPKKSIRSYAYSFCKIPWVVVKFMGLRLWVGVAQNAKADFLPNSPYHT